MSVIFDFIERIVNAVYGTPDPQVQTYFRDLRVTSTELPDDDDDTNYRFIPEPNGNGAHPPIVGRMPASAVQPQVPVRKAGAQATAIK